MFAISYIIVPIMVGCVIGFYTGGYIDFELGMVIFITNFAWAGWVFTLIQYKSLDLRYRDLTADIMYAHYCKIKERYLNFVIAITRDYLREHQPDIEYVRAITKEGETKFQIGNDKKMVDVDLEGIDYWGFTSSLERANRKWIEETSNMEEDWQ